MNLLKRLFRKRKRETKAKTSLSYGARSLSMRPAPRFPDPKIRFDQDIRSTPGFTSSPGSGG